jgi:hypothetical protein
MVLSLEIIPDESSASKNKKDFFFKSSSSWDVSLYYGLFTETDLLPIVLRQDTNYKQSYIYSASLSRPIDYKLRFLDLGFEANLTKHDGLMHHWETNIFYTAKLSEIFNSPISISIGEGMSFASENPKLENKDIGINFYNLTIQKDPIQSSSLLNYAMVEIEFGKMSWEYPRIFLRIHHRSGVFGLYCPPDPACGSNFVSYGMRYPLDKILPF